MTWLCVVEKTHLQLLYCSLSCVFIVCLLWNISLEQLSMLSLNGIWTSTFGTAKSLFRRISFGMFWKQCSGGSYRLNETDLLYITTIYYYRLASRMPKWQPTRIEFRTKLPHRLCLLLVVTITWHHVCTYIITAHQHHGVSIWPTLDCRFVCLQCCSKLQG